MGGVGRVRTRQCNKCPWKKSTDPRDIPNGYCELKHAGLKSTIAKPGEYIPGRELPMMACHESPTAKPFPCVGWVLNQLGPGNNIALRILAMDGRFSNFRTTGPQHERLEDTLPRRK